jgi:hypothetical protein
MIFLQEFALWAHENPTSGGFPVFGMVSDRGGPTAQFLSRQRQVAADPNFQMIWY